MVVGEAWDMEDKMVNKLHFRCSWFFFTSLACLLLLARGPV